MLHDYLSNPSALKIDNLLIEQGMRKYSNGELYFALEDDWGGKFNDKPFVKKIPGIYKLIVDSQNDVNNAVKMPLYLSQIHNVKLDMPNYAPKSIAGHKDVVHIAEVPGLYMIIGHTDVGKSLFVRRLAYDLGKMYTDKVIYFSTGECSYPVWAESPLIDLINSKLDVGTVIVVDSFRDYFTSASASYIQDGIPRQLFKSLTKMSQFLESKGVIVIAALNPVLKNNPRQQPGAMTVDENMKSFVSNVNSAVNGTMYLKRGSDGQRENTRRAEITISYRPIRDVTNISFDIDSFLKFEKEGAY